MILDWEQRTDWKQGSCPALSTASLWKPQADSSLDSKIKTPFSHVQQMELNDRTWVNIEDKKYNIYLKQINHQAGNQRQPEGADPQ